MATAAPTWSHGEDCLQFGGTVVQGCPAATVETSDAQADCAHRDMGGETWEWTCKVTIRETLCVQGTFLLAQLKGDHTEPLEGESRGGAFNCYRQAPVVYLNPDKVGYAPRIAYKLCLYVDLPGECYAWSHDVGPLPRPFTPDPSLEGVEEALAYAAWAAFWTVDYAQQVAQEPLYVL